MTNRLMIAICLALPGTDRVLADTVVAYRGATVETVAKAGRIDNAVIVIRDGRIDAVGADVEIPADARIIDVHDRVIMPALVDVYHPISVGSTTTQSAQQTIVIRGRVFRIPSSAPTTSSAFVRIADELDPRTLRDDLMGLSRLGTGFANLVTRGYGQAVNARVTPEDADNCVVTAHGLLYVAVTNSSTSLDVLRKNLGLSTSSSSGSSRPSASRGGSSSSSGSRSSQSGSAAGVASLWKDVKEGKKPIIINVNNAAAILHTLKLLENAEKVRVVMIATGPHVYETLDQLRGRKGLSLVLRPGLDVAPRSRDQINVARRVADAGVDFGFSLSLNSDMQLMTETPFFPIALLVRSGLDRDQAIAALTLRPAAMLGLDKSLGSIEKGKQANLIILDGDPLDPSARIREVLVEGKIVYEN